MELKIIFNLLVIFLGSIGTFFSILQVLYKKDLLERGIQLKQNLPIIFICLTGISFVILDFYTTDIGHFVGLTLSLFHSFFIVFILYKVITPKTRIILKTREECVKDLLKKGYWSRLIAFEMKMPLDEILRIKKSQGL
jgi:hypothetical protein